MNKNDTIAREIKGDESSMPYAYAVAIPVPDTFQQDDTTDPDIMVAPALQGYDDNGAQAQNLAVAQQTRLGQDIGRVNAHEERKQIQKADYHSQIKPSIESARIANARDVARQRDSEGLEVRGDKYFDETSFERKECEKFAKEQEAILKKLKLNKKKGYDTQEYEVAEYGGEEYDNDGYEYKSVYD